MIKSRIIFLIFLSIVLNAEAQTSSEIDSVKYIDDFDINNVRKGDTIKLGFRSSFHYLHSYKYIKQIKYRKYNHGINKDLASKAFVIKRIGTEKRFLHNRSINKQDIFIRFGKKGFISRKDYMADLTGAIKSGEIITKPIDEYSDAIYPDTIRALTFFYYIKSNNQSPNYYTREYHYYFMKGIHKLSSWGSRPQYEKSLKLAEEVIKATLSSLNYNENYSFIRVFNTGNYDSKKKGYYIEPEDSIFIPIPGYHDAPATKIIFKNIKDFTFLPVDKNFTHPFVKRKDPKRNYYKHRIYARINFRFLNKKDENLPGHCRSVYAEIQSIEFFNDNDDISYWIGTINRK